MIDGGERQQIVLRIIARLFEAAGVKRVVFVDDRFGITPNG